MINAAIVGLGRWGRRLVDSVQEGGSPKGGLIRFTHAVTGGQEKARDYAKLQHLVLGPSFEDVLADAGIDAVVLATPHDLHAQQIAEAARAGKHVFVEKPLALSAASAAAAAAAVSAAGLVLAVGYNRRFLPAARTLKRLVEDNELGTIVHLEGNFSGNFGLAYRPGMWRSTEAGAAGAMTAMGIHVVDMFIHLAGPVDRVSASGIRRAITVDMDDAVSVLLHFKSGVSGYLSTLLAVPRQWRIQVHGTKAWAHMRDHHLLDVCGEDAVPRLNVFEPVDELRLELEAFAEAIRGGAPYSVAIGEAVHGVAVLEAILRSAELNGSTVHV
jgi:predicted dehydrogenase